MEMERFSVPVISFQEKSHFGIQIHKATFGS